MRLHLFILYKYSPFTTLCRGSGKTFHTFIYDTKFKFAGIEFERVGMQLIDLSINTVNTNSISDYIVSVKKTPTYYFNKYFLLLDGECVINVST